MKNVIKGLAMASVVLFLSACKNDKPAENASTVASASVSTPAAQQLTASTTEAATQQAQTAAPASAPTEKVVPNQTQVNPTQTAPTGKTTTVKFDEVSYDWGSIKEGDKMTHIFKFKNTGSNDLIISDARGSCGCTVPEWPKEPIKAGKGGEIKVVFDSAHKSGQQSKTVTITANTEPSSLVLMIKGNVEAKEEKKTE